MSNHGEDTSPMSHNTDTSFTQVQDSSQDDSAKSYAVHTPSPKHHGSGVISFFVFLLVVALLGGLCWGGWLLFNRKDEIFDHGISMPAKSISIGTTTPLDSLDIRKNTGKAVEQTLLGNVYETLVSRNSSGSPAPGIAKSWKISSKGLTYTFTLNKGMHFSNGNDLDAADVVWSLRKVITGKYVGATGLSALASVSNPSATTVVIHLHTPNPTLLRQLYGRAGIVYDKDADIDFSSTALGSGPYKLASWDAGKSLQLKLNTHYWGTKPQAVTSATFTYFADSASMYASLRDNKIDIATPLAPDTMAQATSDAKHSKISLVTGKSSDTVVLAFNATTDSVLSDQRFREAIRYMLDHPRIAATQQGTAATIAGPLSPLDEGYEDLSSLHPHDTAKGAQMAYYFPPRYYNGSLRFVYPQSYGSAIGEMITQQLAAGGVPVTVTMVNDEAWHDSVESKKQFDMTLTTMSGVEDASVFANPDSLFGYDSPQAQNEWSIAEASKNDSDYRSNIAAYAKTVSTQSPADWLYVSTPVTAYGHSVTHVPSNMTEQYFPLQGIRSAA